MNIALAVQDLNPLNGLHCNVDDTIKGKSSLMLLEQSF